MSEAADLKRMLPQSSDAEQGVLSSFLLAPNEVSSMCSAMGVTPQWFHVPAHAETFSTMCELQLAGKPIEFITIAEGLKSRGKFEAVGGPAFISGIFTFLPTAANAAHYLEILQKKHLQRRAIAIGTKCAAAAYEADVDPVALLEAMHGELTAILGRKSKRATLLDVMKEIIEEVRSGRNDVGLLPVTLEGIGGRLNLYNGDLLIVSAPTSCGKSALAAQLALDQAANGKRVALYPLEMAQKQMLKRAIAQRGGNNADWVRNIVKSADTFEKQEKAAKTIRLFVDTANDILRMRPHMRDDLFTLESICADLRAEHAKEPFSFAVIDYLQLLTTQQKHERKQLQIAHITQTLKRLAGELEMVICLPSQVNKQGGTREGEDAENDASALIKIHAATDASGNPLADVAPGRVTVWKQREGARHIDLPLKFNGLLTRFEYHP